MAQETSREATVNNTKLTMAQLTPGFRFYPTEEELICFYLRNKLEGKRHDLHRVIPVIDIYNTEPTELPNLCGELCRGDTEQWFFFAPRQEREARGGRPSRTTASGYWKATGSPNYVYSSDNTVIGLKKTMVFYRGKAPNGRKTKWKMHEYRAIEGEADPSGTNVSKLRYEYSLCRIYVISGTFQAFDRRPFEVVERQPQLVGDGATTSSQNISMVERISSPETSHSGANHANPPAPVEGPGCEIVDAMEPSLWELEDQLNWP